jgi:hypothetical protein
MAGGIFDRLRALFAPSATGAPIAGRVLFVEEDTWGEVEVLPASNADWCRAEFDKIAAFSDKHRAPGDAGWTDIYIRKSAPSSLADLRIPLAQTLGVLRRHLPAFDSVTSGSFYAPEPIATAGAFGPSPKAALVVVGDKDQTLVESILIVADEDDGSAGLMTALQALPSGDRLMVVDWVRGELIELRS